MADHFIIAGAQRSATTYLYRMLEQHPDIALAKPVRPEPKYFIRDGYDGDASAYRNEFFNDQDARWLGEKSTSYIEHPLAAERISRMLPRARILFMLRDPVERAISNHRFSAANGLEPLDLEAALDAEPQRTSSPGIAGISVSPFAYVARGRYASQLDIWMRWFPRAQLQLLVTEHVVGSEAAIRGIFESFGLRADVPLAGVERAINAAGEAVAAVPDRLRRRLRDEFTTANRELAERYGVDIRGWQ